MTINFENIPIYSIFIIASLCINCIIIFMLGKIQKIDKNIIVCSLTYEMIGIICGAKILNMLQIKENNSFYYAGFSSYGGVIGAIVFLLFFSRIYKIPLKQLLNIYVPILPLMYGVSKLGCFFGGCCYGIHYSGFGSIIYEYASDAPLYTSLLPIQFIESISNTFIFIYILIIYKKHKDDMSIIGQVFFLCGICKLVLEFFRDSWAGYLSSTQAISIVFIFIGLLIIIFNNKIKKE